MTGERSGLACVSRTIARPVASTASSWPEGSCVAARNSATFSQASAASRGRATRSHNKAIFVNNSGLSAATPLRLLNVLIAFERRHALACLSAASNSNRHGESSSVAVNGTLIRNAGGKPDASSASMRTFRSSSDPSDFSTSHSIVDSARPNCPTWAAT